MLTALALSAHHFGGGFGFGFGWLFLLIPLFWIGVVILIVALARRRWRGGLGAGNFGPGFGPGHYGHGGFGPWGGARGAEATLSERFAQGDIDEQEYRARLEVLRANSGFTPPPTR